MTELRALTSKEEQAYEIIKALGGNQSTGMCKCPAHDDGTPSLHVQVKAGKVLFKCHGGCSQESVLQQLRARGLWPEMRSSQLQRQYQRLRQRTAVAPNESDEASRLDRAKELLDAARHTKGGREKLRPYFANRGIKSVPISAMFLTIGDCRDLSLPTFPAMICPFIREGEHVGAHLTMLSRDGSKKLATKNPRKMSGPVSGGYVAVSKVEADKRLIIGEGIENAAAASQIVGGLPAIAAGSAGNLKSLIVPSAGEYIICGDNDEPGRKGATALAQRLSASGRLVRIAFPPRDYNDWNEALMKHNDVAGLAAQIENAPQFEESNVTDEQRLDTLAKLDDIAYDKQRTAAAKALGIRTSVLDKEVAKRRNLNAEEEGIGNQLQSVDPWHDAVKGRLLLAELVETIERHIKLPSDRGLAVALWILHAHAHDAARHSPTLGVELTLILANASCNC